MARILVGAGDGLHILEDGREVEVVSVGWADSAGALTTLAPGASARWAIVDAHEIWRSEGSGWTHVVTARPHEIRCIADTAAGVLIGTAEAHLHRVVEPPAPLETVGSFGEVEGRDGWYTPWGGPPDTRSIAEDDDAVYVNVHVGGIPRSRDGGETWEPTIDVDADVHRVWAGRSGVFAACARGLAVSRDGGDTWRIEAEGLHASYCRGVTVCGDTVLVSASTGPRGGRAAVYRRPLGGGPFERCERGLPEWFDGNVDSGWLDASPELAAFGTPDGRVFASDDEGASWGEVATGVPNLSSVVVER
jgi:hypothetical protein